MKRDMELVRSILMATEEEKSGQTVKPEVDGYSKDQVNYHIAIMIDAGLVEGILSKECRPSVPEARIVRMTWYGHEFLDACRDDTRWEKTKGIVARMGGATIEVVLKTLTELMMNQAKGMV